jgi:hypothetical protein
MRAQARSVVSRFLRKAGGNEFWVYIKDSNVKQAFRQAVDDARHESGHGGYTGTIAEKSEFKIRQHSPMTQEQADKFTGTDIEKNDKWGPAFAIPISASENGPTVGWLFYGIASS